MRKAFVLGAGIGERLRPLTLQLPKPLVPFFHEPIICHAFRHMKSEGVESFVVNTHHLAGKYAEAFADGRFEGCGIEFRNEMPERLETAGGIANVRDLLADEESFWVYNGDILADLDLASLREAHLASGHLVTLGVRSHGPALHMALDESAERVVDIRNLLGTGNEGSHLFTGIYAVRREFFDWLTPGKKESVIAVFLRMLESGVPIGVKVLDRGEWWDLGNRESYLEAHRLLHGEPRFLPAEHPAAYVHETAKLSGMNVIGPGAIIEAGVEMRECVLWPGARVEAGARLERCIVRSGCVAGGTAHGVDF